MLYVILKGVHTQLDGEYPIDGTSFKNTELRMIKKMSGVRAGELSDAFAAGDNDLLVAFAAIALTRAGKQYVEQVLWEAEGGTILFEEHVEEGDADPPPQEPSKSSDESNVPSGDVSNNGSEHSPPTLSQSSSGAPV